FLPRITGPHVAAHNRTIINDTWRCKCICALHKGQKLRQLIAVGRITRREAAVRPMHTSSAPSAGSAQSNGIREQTSERRDQYRRKILVFTGFSAFLYPHQDE